MIPGLSYIVSCALVAALLFCGSRASAGNGSVTVFTYSITIRIALFACIPVWIFAAAIVTFTANPGTDATIAEYFSYAFLVVAVGSAMLYFSANRFYVEIGEEKLLWRKFFVVRRIDYGEIDSILIKNLNNGLLKISIYRNKQSVLEISSVIEGFYELRSLVEIRSRKFEIPIERK